METNFEIEIWPNTKKLKTVYASILVITIFAWISFTIGSIFWDEYSYTVTNLRGISYPAGWPVKLYWIGLYLGIAGPVGFILMQFMIDRKNPSLALSKSGLFINQQLLSKAHVEWSNISRIEKSVEGDKVTMEIYFKDAHKIIDAQGGMKKAFLKENLKDGKPLTIENKLAAGDLNALADKAIHYTSSAD